MKKFFRLVSMFALAGATLAYTGCTDYDEDIDKINDRIDALETGRLKTVEEQVASLQTTVTSLQNAQDAADKALKALKETHDADVKDLEASIADVDKKIEDVKKTIGNLADKKYVDDKVATLATAKEVEDLLGKVGKLEKALENIPTSDVVKAAKDAADAAQTDATKALGDIKALKEALGVYAEAGKLDEALMAKLDIDAFDAKFTEQLEKALENDGKITTEIASAIAEATAEISKMFYQELRSLVFIPDLYVNGIESVEYTYANGWPLFLTANMDAIEGTDDNDVKYSINEKQMIEPIIDAKNRYDIDPEKVVAYEMNPSSAQIDPEQLSFISRDVKVLTKAAAAEPVKADFVKVEDGNIYVGMKAIGRKVKMQPYDDDPKEATMFALQAIVKSEDGKEDITVTSDYANILASVMTFDAVAFANKVYQAEDCSVIAEDGSVIEKNDHLYGEAIDALENAPSVQVAWDGTVDLAKLVEVHYSVDSDVESSVKNHEVYDMEENAYGLSYEFRLIDYLSGENKTSDSQYVTLDGTVLNPCGTTNGEANGTDSELAIGRRPLVQVLVKHGDSVLLVGYIKFEIVRTVDYVIADEFPIIANFGCKPNVYVPAWHKFAENIIANTSYSKEEFEKLYELEAGEQYIRTEEGEFVNIKDLDPAPAPAPVGTVVAVIDDEVGSTTSVFEWTLTPKEMDAVYKMAGHTATIYVRYIRKGAPVTSIHEGIYVPLTVTVKKPATGTVGVKLSNYWFDNSTKAVINVNVPKKGYDVRVWKTNINQVWEGNVPVFNPEEGFASYTDSIFSRQGAAQNGGYKYYFSAVQPSIAARGKTYDLSTTYDYVEDKFSGKQYKIAANTVLEELETAYALDVTKGMYRNGKLWANVHGDPVAKKQLIAELDPETGIVTYKNDSEYAKILLNEYASNPRKDAKLFTNVGVTAYTPCKIAFALTNAVNPYHFLRPIDIAPKNGGAFTDGADADTPPTQVNLYDLLTFTDWRNQSFAKNNAWYFGYYKVSAVKVDIANATTDLNGGKLGETKLSDKTNLIKLSHMVGNADKTNTTVDLSFAESVAENAVKTAFGMITYENNGSTLETGFTLRLPVEVTYAWGTIYTHADVKVNPTLGNQ